MAFDCQECGFRNNEVKGGGAVPLKGTQVTLIVTSEEDLKRDVLKSDSAAVSIPELELELGHGTLGGQYTTVEGLIGKILRGLDGIGGGGGEGGEGEGHAGEHKLGSDSSSTLGVGLGIVMGDSLTNNHSNNKEIEQQKARFREIKGALESFSKGQNLPFTLVIRDPLGNSFISAPLGSFLPPEMDKNLIMEDFERTFDENEEFGLNDMNTADYEVIIEEEESSANLELPSSSSSSTATATTTTATTKQYRGDVPVDRPDRVAEFGSRKKVVDHPTAFAMGTDVNDNTAGGIKPSTLSTTTTSSSSTAAASTSSSGSGGEGEGFYSGPKGWVFARPNERGIPELPHNASNGNDDDDDEEEEKEKEEKEEKVYKHVREFDPEDLTDPNFDPAEEFRGGRKGRVFRLGGRGVGYYTDRRGLAYAAAAAAKAAGEA